MDISLHTLRFFCPECQAECSIFEIEANAAGEITFYGKCNICSQPGTAYAFKSSMAIIKRFCREADVDSQTFLPKPPDGLSDYDRKFERDMGIDPGE